jgi:type IV pilus assembly protein PilY1
VYVGTGQYLGNTDIPGVSGAKPSATTTQSMYGLVDDLSDAPLISPLRTNLVEQKLNKSGNSATITSVKVDLSVRKGWYIDLPETGERIVTHPAVVLGVLQFTTNIPDGSDPCLPGGRSWSYGVDYATGGAIINPSNSSVSWFKFLGQALASRVVLIKLPSGKVLGMVRQSDATTQIVDISVPASSSIGKRKSWREIIVR